LESTVRQPTQVRWGTCLTRLTGFAVTSQTLTASPSRNAYLGKGCGSGKFTILLLPRHRRRACGSCAPRLRQASRRTRA
jgi:hypothetical protein